MIAAFNLDPTFNNSLRKHIGADAAIVSEWNDLFQMIENVRLTGVFLSDDDMSFAAIVILKSIQPDISFAVVSCDTSDDLDRKVVAFGGVAMLHRDDVFRIRQVALAWHEVCREERLTYLDQTGGDYQNEAMTQS